VVCGVVFRELTGCNMGQIVTVRGAGDSDRRGGYRQDVWCGTDGGSTCDKWANMRGGADVTWVFFSEGCTGGWWCELRYTLWAVPGSVIVA
jgi:hypothetical protein